MTKNNMNAMTTDFARASKISFGNHTIMATLKNSLFNTSTKRRFPPLQTKKRVSWGEMTFYAQQHGILR